MAQRWTLVKFYWNRRTDLFLDNCLCKKCKANLKMIIQHRPNLREDDEKADQFSGRNQEDEPCCVSEMNIMGNMQLEGFQKFICRIVFAKIKGNIKQFSIICWWQMNKEIIIQGIIMDTQGSQYIYFHQFLNLWNFFVPFCVESCTESLDFAQAFHPFCQRSFPVIPLSYFSDQNIFLYTHAPSL